MKCRFLEVIEAENKQQIHFQISFVTISYKYM